MAVTIWDGQVFSKVTLKAARRGRTGKEYAFITQARQLASMLPVVQSEHEGVPFEQVDKSFNAITLGAWANTKIRHAGLKIVVRRDITNHNDKKEASKCVCPKRALIQNWGSEANVPFTPRPRKESVTI